MTPKTDEEIALMVQRGNQQAFGLLVERYQQKILRYASRFLFYNQSDAEDVVQEIFIKTYINIQSFDTERRFSPWIYRIAHNQIVNILKKKSKEPLIFFDADTFLPYFESQEKIEEKIDKADLRKILEHCLNKLNPRYREPLVLYYLEGFDYKEITDIMHIPTSTVGVRLKRGKEALKKIYNQTHESGKK